MNVNPLKQIWQSGKTVIGTYIMYSRDVTTVELAAAAGLDFVVFDLEHFRTKEPRKNPQKAKPVSRS